MNNNLDINKKIYKSSGPLYCNYIVFEVYSDKSKTNKIFTIRLHNKYLINNDTNYLRIHYFLNTSVEMIKLYNKLRNDILLYNIDQEDLFDLIKDIENINHTYNVYLKEIFNKENKNHVYETYLYIIDLLKKFCEMCAVFCNVSFINATDETYMINKNIVKDLNEC